MKYEKSQYQVKSTVKHDGVVYNRGDEIELSGADARALTEAGVIGPVGSVPEEKAPEENRGLVKKSDKKTKAPKEEEEEGYEAMSAEELKEELDNREIAYKGNMKKADLIDLLETDDAENGEAEEAEEEEEEGGEEDDEELNNL